MKKKSFSKRLLTTLLSGAMFLSSIVPSLAAGPAVAAGGTPESIIGLFQKPDVDAKGMMRYWLLDAAVTFDQLKKEMTDMYEAGFGGVEVTLFSSQVAFDNSQYGFGTEAWRSVMKNILKIADSFEDGFRVDFTLTPCWPVAVNNIDPNDPAADQEMVSAVAKITAPADVSATVPMAAIGTKEFSNFPFIFENKLVSAVVAKVADVSEDGKLTLDKESLKVVPTRETGKTTVAGIPDVSKLDQQSETYTYVTQLYADEKGNPQVPDTSIFFKDSGGNPITLREPLADTQKSWQADLSGVDFGQYKPSGGEEIQKGDYVLYGFYNRGTGGCTSDYSAFWSVIGSVFQDGMPGVAYYTSVFNHAGVEAVKTYLDEHIFCDQELVDLMKKAAAKTGGSYFEDSLENKYPDGIAWSEGYETYFKEENKYEIQKYLPFIAGAAASSAGDEDQYHNDYNTALGRMYEKCHVQELQDYIHEKIDFTYRAQAYLTNNSYEFDLSSTSAAVDMADVESLAFGTNFDNYRLAATGVKLADHKFVSDEAFALQEGIVYNLTEKRVTKIMNENFSAGANRMIFHGSSYMNANAATPETGTLANQWPGWHAFMSLCTDPWNARQPYWEDIDGLAGYIARTQAVLQNGEEKADVLVYSQTAYDPFTRTREGDKSAFTGLLDAGYTYDIVGNDGLLLAAEKLAADSSYYKAVVVNNITRIPLEDMEKLLEIGRKGVPIYFYKAVPEKSYGLTHTDGEIKKILDDMEFLDFYESVADEAELVAALQMKNVVPYIQYQQKDLRTQIRKDSDGTMYYYLYNHSDQEICTTITMDKKGVPYRLNAWTGTVEPAAQYAVKGNKTQMDLSLQAQEAVIVAVADNNAAFPAAVSNPILSSTADTRVIGGEAAVVVGKNSKVEAVFADGTQISSRVQVPEKTVFSRGDLVIESWGPDESTELTYDTKKTVVPMGSCELRSWTDLKATESQLAEFGVKSMDFVSGRGTYAFEIETGELDGAYLTLTHGDDNIASIRVNGTDIGKIDQSAVRFDLGNRLKPGKNKIEVTIASTLVNRVTATHPRFASYKHAAYGITAATIEPYKILTASSGGAEDQELQQQLKELEEKLAEMEKTAGEAAKLKEQIKELERAVGQANAALKQAEQEKAAGEIARQQVKQLEEAVKKANAELKKAQLREFKAKKVTLKSVKSPKKKQLKVTWKKISGAAGYQLQYAAKSNFKGKKTVTVKKAGTVAKTIKKLKSNGKYYVRVRAYKSVDGKKVYTKFSAKKSVRIK